MMSRLSKNIIYNIFGQGLILVLSFVAVKFIFKQLGDDVFGIIYFALTLTPLIYAVLEAGISSTAIREVAAHFEQDPNYIRGLIKTVSSFYWIAYLVLSVIIWFAVPFIVGKWVNLKTIDPELAVQMLRILLIANIIILPQRFYASLIKGLQRMEFNNLIDVATLGLQQLGIVAILILGGKAIHVAYWFAVYFGLIVTVYIFASAHFFSWRALVPGYSGAVVERCIGFARKMMSVSVLSMIYVQIDKLIISKTLPIGALGYYGVSYTGLSKGSLLADSVAQAAYPSFSTLFKNGDRDSLVGQYRKLHDFVCVVTVPLFAIVPFAAMPLFTFIFNKEIAQTLFLPLLFLSIGFYMHSTVVVPYYFSLAVGKPEISAKTNFLALFVVLPVTIALIYFFGLVGAGLSWVFYHIFGYFYGVPRICKECLGIKVKDWFLHIFKIVVPAVLVYGAAWIALAIFGKFSIPSLASAYFLSSAIFLFLAYKLVGKDLKSVLTRIFRALKEKYGF